MKPSNLLLTATMALLMLTSSCKKENTPTATEAEIKSTFELTTDDATSNFMAEDDNDVLMEAAEEENLLGNFAPVIESNLACATVTVTPQTGFPKTILIRFDSTCTNPRGIKRSGTIRIVISDSLRRSGSTAVMTFENYYVNYFKREGTHTFTNTSQPGVKSWQRKIENGKVTAPRGRYWLHASVKNVTQTAGVNTPTQLFDDVFSMTGNASVTNARGISRTANILEALQKKYACRHIDKGRIRFEGPNHFAILDYGDGECNNTATISINGRTPRIIILP